MNSKRVASGHACFANIANPLCFLALFEARGLCLLNLDGGRNNGKPHFYSAKSMDIRIQHIASSGNRKTKLLARTRRQGVLRCEIYVLRVCLTLTIFVDYFNAKSLKPKSMDPQQFL